MSALDHALGYLRRGWVPLPIPAQRKAPVFDGWQHFRPDRLELTRKVDPKGNVGVLLGEPSGGLADVDLDCPEAVRLAARFLASTMTFGRASKRRSHYVYQAPGADTRKYSDPLPDAQGKRVMLVELRATAGLQTVFPPSVHPSGERVEFDEGAAAEPLASDPAELARRVCRLAVATLLARQGCSDDEACALAEGWSESEAAALPEEVRRVAREWLGIATPVPPPSRAASQAEASLADREKRATAYLAKMQPATSGSGGHEATWRAAVALVRGFDLGEPEALALLERDFNPRCTPPWSVKELRHKVASAGRDARVPRGYLLEDEGRDVRAMLDGSAPAAPFGGFGGSTGRDSAVWPEPRPVPEGRLPVPPLEADMLPQALRPWLMDIAERACCPPDFAAVGALVAASSLVGCTIGIRPKQHDDWTVIPNLWGAVVGAPGVMKSPMLSEVLKQVQRLEAEAREAFDGATGDLDFERAIHEARRKEVERKIAAAVKTGEDPAPLRAEFGELPSLPTPKRYIVNDATVEKLGELLKQNPRGLLMFRDELMGWLRTLDKEGHENDRAFYLEAWDGKGSYTYDRIGRGTGHIERACLSVLGGIQPGALAEYLRAAVRGGAGADGLMQRFQLLVWPDVGHAWRNVDRYPDGEGRRRALALFQRLDALDPAAVGASCPEAEVAFLHYTRAAQQEADRWREALERQLRSEADHPAIDSHLSKYRSLMPSLALLFHLLEVVDGGEPGAVRVESVDRAVRWCAYLEAHARRAYQSVTQGASIAAAALAKKLAKLPEGFPMPFRARDVRHKGWSGLTEPDEVKEAAEILVDLGWLREEEARTGGRPTVVYHLSPRVRSR